VIGERDARIAQIAALQRGRIARRQLRAAGVSSAAVTWLVKRQRLFSSLRCVFAVGQPAPAELTAETEALLAMAEGAALSHLSAARLWGLAAPDPQAAVDVLVAARQSAAMSGVTVHRSRCLAPVDLRIHRGLPVTSPARLLLDLADDWTERQVERAFDQALVERILRPPELAELLARTAGRRGIPLLRELLAAAGTTTLTRSEAEERMLALIRDARLPRPRVNARVGGYEVDFYWPEQRFAVEVDGYRYHSTPRRFENDHRKDGALRDLGIDAMRVTWRQIEREPYAVIARLAQGLGQAGRKAA
jgi:very-short-patch-repair endonuclease